MKLIIMNIGSGEMVLWVRESIALLEGTQIQLPAPKSGSSLSPITPEPRYSISFSGLHGP